MPFAATWMELKTILLSEVGACLQCRRPGFHPWVGKIPGGGNGNPLQYPWLENFMDRGAWWAAVHGVSKSLA